MKVYVLMQTDTDTAGPSVSVYRTAEEAIRTALHDVRANGTKIVDENGYNPPHRGVVWHCTHMQGKVEHVSEVTEHELEVRNRPPKERK